MGRPYVQSVQRAFFILSLLRATSAGMALSDISRSLKLNIATVHRLLQTLILCQAVQQDPQTRQYRLDPHLLLYGKAVLDGFDFVKVARPQLVQLSTSIGELASLGILDSFEMVYIDHFNASDGVMYVRSTLGRREQPHCTALGKALLAWLPKGAIDGYLNGHPLPKRTENTITDPGELRRALLQVRERGYSLDLEENEIGICCVAAPILNSRGEAVAAVSTSGPARRMIAKGLETTLKDQVVLIASRISDSLIG